MCHGLTMKRYVLTEMRIVELEVLENELAEYVRLAASGETMPTRTAQTGESLGCPDTMGIHPELSTSA